MEIVVSNVSAGYRSRLVIKDVSFTVATGQFCALLGPNGSGKTTLLSVIDGLLAPAAGSVTFDGKTLTEHRHGRRRVAFVSQAHRTTFPFAVRDVVLTGRLPYVGVFAQPGRQDVEIAEAALNRLGISDLIQRPYTELSGGERQLVLIARALAQQPSVMLLDEPTSYLDLANQHRVLTAVREFVAEGITVLASLHDLNHALGWADQAVLLAPGGTVLATGPPVDVLTPTNVATAYGQAVDVLTVAGRTVVLPGQPPN